MRRPNELTALEALAQIEVGELTSETLVEACLEHISGREEAVGAWQFLNPDATLAAARRIDQSKVTGALQGIPVAVKDVFDTAHMPTAYGSPIYDGHLPASDAATITVVRANNGIILGKTVTTEFAYFHPGKTANPLDVQRTPGGSSSGSAAAVADFMAPLAFGTQTVGSTIRPASYCGIVGYKPSFGLIDRTGIRPLADEFDTVGLFSRDVADIAYFASILSRRPKLKLSAPLESPPRVGLCRTADWASASPDAQSALEFAAERASKFGANIIEIKLPKIFTQISTLQSTIVDFQAANSAAYELNFHRDQVSKTYIARAETGLALSANDYDVARISLNRARADFDEIMKSVDVLMMLSAPGEAPIGLEATGNPIFNRLGTAMRVPCLSLPGLVGSFQMPIGVQLLGSMNNDRQVLIAGDWLFRILNH